MGAKVGILDADIYGPNVPVMLGMESAQVKVIKAENGADVVEPAFNYGVKITGCTVHLLSLEVDSGKILKQAAVPILPDDTVQDLQKRIQVQEHIIYPAAIAEYLQKIS